MMIDNRAQGSYKESVSRVVFLAIPLLILAVFLGRDSATDPAQAAVQRAAARTADASSSRFELSWYSLDAQPSEYYVKIQGVMDYIHHRGRIHYSPASEVIYDGDVAYLKWPMPWRKESPWLRYERDQDDLLQLQDRALRNPLGLLAFLKGAGADVRKVGTERVRDVSTVHYEGTLDLQKVVDQASPAQRPELQAMLDLMHESEPTTVPFGLWVDADGVAHRLRIDQGEGNAAIIEYYDFGTAVAITPPAASEIMSFEDFAQEIDAHADDSSCAGSNDDTNDDSDSDHDSETLDETTFTICVSSVSLGGG